MKPDTTPTMHTAPLVALLRLCRFYYALPMSFILGLTIVYARDGQTTGHWTSTILSSLALAMVIAGGYVFNDICDHRVDCINTPHRPIAAGAIPANIAHIWTILLFLAGLVLAAISCRWPFVIVLLAITAGLIFYDMTSKRLNIGKQILVAALMTSIYPLAIAQTGLTEGSRIRTLLFFPVWLFLTSFSYEILKDIRDSHGDLAVAGRPTWINAYPRAARRVASAAVIAGTLVLILPAYAGCRSTYWNMLPLPMAAGAISSLLPIRAAMAMIYLECVLVGVITTADLFA